MAQFKNKNFKQKVLFSILLLVLVFMGFNFLKAFIRGRQVDVEINNLENEISNLQKDTTELTELIEYFNSNAYIEEKARVDLGLKKQGEKVILITDDFKNNVLENTEGENDEKPVSNIVKWWNYFFKK